MNERVSARARKVDKSATSTLSEQAALLRQQGTQIIDLAQGETEDIFTPKHVKGAAIAALEQNRTKYTPASGTRELREAVLRRFEQNGLKLGLSQVMASAGAKQCVFNFMMATLNPGDEVLVPSPYWVSYLHQVELAGGIPTVVPTAAPEFKLTADILQGYLRPRSRVLVLNNPNNPSGAVYTQRELEEILELVLSRNILVMADEVYDRLTYDGKEHVCFASINREAAEHTVTINAVSKSFCMTGWRLGYAAGPSDLIGAMERIQSHSTSCPNTLAQAAAWAALEGDQVSIAELRGELDTRRRLTVAALQGMPGVQCRLPAGAFYVFPNVAGYRGPGGQASDGTVFAAELLQATGVMLVPGAAFGVPSHVRLCYAAAHASLESALAQMKAWLERRQEHVVEEGGKELRHV